MIRVVLPANLRTLASVGKEVELRVQDPVTQRTLLDALEAEYPELLGTIRDATTKKRRPLLRFFACEEDLSDESPDAPLPEEVKAGKEPYLIIGAIAGGSAERHAEADAARAIEATILDYFEGWFDGDAERIKRALHPELAKRPDGAEDSLAGRLGTLTAQEMIDATAAGVGKTRDVPDRRIEIEVVDVFGDIASATVRSTVYHEYVHLVRTREGWKIVNALWQRT